MSLSKLKHLFEKLTEEELEDISGYSWRSRSSVMVFGRVIKEEPWSDAGAEDALSREMFVPRFDFPVMEVWEEESGE